MTKIELCRKLDDILFRMAADQNKPIKPFKSTTGSFVGFVDCEPFLEKYRNGEYPSLSAEDIMLLVSFGGTGSFVEDDELGYFDVTVLQQHPTGYLVGLRNWFSLPERKHTDDEGFIYCYPVKPVQTWERDDA